MSLAILWMDTSGSMRVGRQLAASREAVEHVLSWIDSSTDEIGLFSFDQTLRLEVPFTKDPARIRDGVARLDGIGAHWPLRCDRVGGEGARRAAVAPPGRDRRHGRRRYQQHVDGGPGVRPGQRHRRAGVRDRPAVAARPPGDGIRGSQLDWLRGRNATGQPLRVDRRRLDDGERAGARQRRRPRSADTTATPVQMLTFESAAEAGWYDLEVRVRHKDAVVRARSGYFAGGARPAYPNGRGERAAGSGGGSRSAGGVL